MRACLDVRRTSIVRSNFTPADFIRHVVSPFLALFRRFLIKVGRHGLGNDYRPPPVDAFPPFMYLEPIVAQAPRFARHLIDKRRHLLDLTARKTRSISGVKDTV